MLQRDWSDGFLSAQRAVGDPVADAVVRRVFERQDGDALNAFMGRLVSDRDIPSDLPPEIIEYLVATSALPDWADVGKMREAERLFNVFGLVSLIALVCASLPECYTMRTGVRILALTGQLGAHANRRLHQTASMVLAVMARHGLEGDGTGVRQAQKVRLIHAVIRYRILGALGADGVPRSAGDQVPQVVAGAFRSIADVIAHQGFDWTIERDGYPINQEDLAFTLLTFGYVIPRGMRTLGVPLSDAECDAFVHAWNVTGAVMGVDESLMAHSYADAEVLFGRIKARQAGPSEAGASLLDSLLRVVERDLLHVRVLRPLAPILVRILVGTPTATMLGLDARHGAVVTLVHRAVVAVVSVFCGLFGKFWWRLHPLRTLSAWLGRRLIVALNEATYHGRQAPLEIPEGWA
jgi:hypothetical protein